MKEFETMVLNAKPTTSGFRLAEELVRIELLGTEVVRCKDCKYKVGENTKYNDARCGIHERGNNRELTVGDYDYCSWGERKESK